MANKGNMTLRVEPELKEQAAALFKSLGMDLSTATGIFYRQALRYHGLPFEVRIDEPNEITYAAMEEAERMLKDPNTKRFSSVDDLFAELNA
ncbi:MAG: type II toxin-antitoxin system RelB/DinJ family antitoxin [Oscillospiraceae bacterium]